MKQRPLLFLTALSQVTCVAMNVVFIGNVHTNPKSFTAWSLMLVTGFMISLIWTFNVKKVVFGTNVDRLTYALGAMTGTGVGFLLSHTITKFI